MSDPRDESAQAGGGTAPGPSSAPSAARRNAPSLTLPRLWGREGWGKIATGLAGALLLVVTLVATGPLWAPLLPWGAPSPRQNGAAQPPREPLRQPTEVTASPALADLDRRVAALEAKSAAAPSDLTAIRQEVAKLAASATDLATRIETIDNTVHSQAAGDPTDIALVLALLQIRDAVEGGRPFAAAYDALARLAGARPEIAAAAAPLAEAAKTGLAGRAVLVKRLRELAPAIAAADARPKTSVGGNSGNPDWAGQALARLKGLVKIRRIGEPAPGQSGETAAAAVTAAQLALAGGDLAGALHALDALNRAPAEAAGPWLRMAKERLAAEMALQKIEALLVARLGARAGAPADSGPPR